MQHECKCSAFLSVPDEASLMVAWGCGGVMRGHMGCGVPACSGWVNFKKLTLHKSSHRPAPPLLRCRRRRPWPAPPP